MAHSGNLLSLRLACVTTRSDTYLVLKLVGITAYGGTLFSCVLKSDTVFCFSRTSYWRLTV